VTYERFRATVEAMLDDIPDAFLQELQGVHALREAKAEEGYRDVWRMGEYLDPGPEDFLGGSEGLGRHVALYYGSFVRIAENDPDFDWEGEIWETLTHELQHHVESLAGDGRLIEEDLLEARFFEREDEVEDEDDAGVAADADAAHDADDPSKRTPRRGGWLRRLFGGG
jgi:hypothetical protein